MLSFPSNFNSAALCTKKTDQVTRLDSFSLSQQICPATTCHLLKPTPAFQYHTSAPFSGECQVRDLDVSPALGCWLIVRRRCQICLSSPNTLVTCVKRTTVMEKYSSMDSCATALSAHRPAPQIHETAHRGADGWRSLTWLWGARPEQEASQEKAEATQGSRWFHCCAWQVSPLNSHVQQRILPWNSQRGWIVCVWSLFSLWVWGL